YNVKASGKLTIHGVTKEVTIPGTVTVKGGNVTTNTKFMVKTADYGIKIPGMVASKIADQIEVTVNSILSQK
ncbi:MAG: YceI family protein, partial [Chitinophagaceae bacterium]